MPISTRHTNVPVAIIGMACRLPGADGLDQFWRLVSSGGSVVAELPPERLDQELYYHPARGKRGKSYSKLGAICSSREFRRDRCPIPQELERAVDRAHLMTCEVAAEALRHARMDPFNLPLRNTGVYIGHAQGSDLGGEYIYGTCIEEAAQFIREVPGFQQLPGQQQEAIVREIVETVRAQTPKRAADSPDLSIHMVAGTIAKAFGLTGPYLAVNSACASSLQTTMMAVRALQLGRIDMAIVGGASDCKGDTLVLFSHAQSLSETGSRPFDAEADGLICSEGYVALVLKTLPRALADGDPIQAIIMGLGLSSDGRGKSLWAPRREGQVAAMQRAYGDGLDMSTLQYIEAHATSTSLGDATELGALAEVLASRMPPGKKIPVTSVKANIGHALESAGVAGMIKTILCMQNQTFAPAINIKSLNPKIDWPSAPIYILTKTEPWPEQPGGLPRRAAVNAFGIGGLNVHIVLEEFTEARREALNTAYKATGAQPANLQPAAANASVKTSAQRDAVAVIGMGCIFPGALHLKQYWDLLTSGRDPKGTTPPGRWRADLALEPGSRKAHRTPTTLGGYITDFAYDWKRHKVPPKQVEQADPLQFMLLEAADQALADAGYDKKPFDRSRVGVMVGTEFISDFGAQLEIGLKLPPLEVMLKQSLTRRGVAADKAAQIAAQFSDVLLSHWPALIDETGSFSTSTLASRITKTMDLMGGAAAMDGGHSSAAAALTACVDALLSGDCDMMICAAGQRCMTLLPFEGLSVGGLLATADRPPSPFDAAASGFVPGEGVGVVLLKRLSDARRDGDRIHVIIRGIGAAHGPSAEVALQEAMNRALHEAQIDPGDVAVIELDGAGLPQADEEQIRAILSVYGQSQRREPLLAGTVVGQIGHTLGASAMASLIKASLEVETGQLPKTVGLESPLPILTENARVIRAATAPQPIRHTTSDGRQFAAVSSYDKGLAYHILLERGEKVAASSAAPTPASTQKPQQTPPMTATAPAPAPAASAPVMAAAMASNAAPGAGWRICRFGAPTPDQLGSKMQQAVSNSAAVFANAPGVQFSAGDRARLAIVADTAESLARKLQSAAKQLGNPAAQTVLEQQGCFYRQLTDRPRVAFLFPGQGSHYAGMLRELVRDVPAAATAMREIDAAMLRHGLQTFAQMAWENVNQLGSDIWVTQVVMLLADVIVHAAITDLGIRPDLVAGHSYGEIAALTAAGVWDFDTVVRFARARYESIEATPNARGTMLSATATPAQIERLAATMRDRVYVANINAPDQTVVGGRPEGLKQLAALLESHGHKAQILTVPCPYHTPLMEGVGAMLKRTLDALPMRPPRVPMLSTVTNRYVADPDEIRANLAAQLTTPVRYVDLIERIAGEQETVFVEVGPQQALTRLNRRILEGRQVAGIVGCDNSKRPGVEQLLHVKALLECVGVLAAPSPATGAEPVRVTKQLAPRGKGSVTHFDATERRREKMRQSAAKSAAIAGNGEGGGNGSPPTARPKAPAQAARISMPPNRPAMAPAASPQALHREARPASLPPKPAISPAPAPAPVASRAAPPTAAPQAAASQAAAPPTTPAITPPVATSAESQVASQSAALPLADLEKFLINFVVEQTGYPPEVVELDADLEADLGIDSIKKAQMFGELREYFDVTPTDNLTLDDFPTLRHIVNFLAAAPQKGPSVASAAASPTPQLAPPPAAAAPSVARATTSTAPAAPVAAPSLDTAELEKFLINFVVEQTGYPPEVVELDADLEADLGIDSIKKAQMFGELREYFDVTPTDNLTLDDFPTLRHIVNFLATAPQKAVSPATGESASAESATTQSAAPSPLPSSPAPQPAAPLAAPAADTAELEKFLINFVVEQTGYPPEVVELDADLEADLGIDSIKKAQMFGELREYFDVTSTDNLTLDDFPTLRHIVNFLAAAPQKGAAPATASAEPVPAPSESSTVRSSATSPPAAVPATTEAASSVDTAELERFLINFVVEQTGYPPEVVELDADLEADLGIDSIKKAQMFGELREYFDVTPTDNLTLDDFPTLRHIVNFLATARQKGAAPTSGKGAAAPVSAAASASGVAAAVSTVGGPVNVDMLHVRGTPYEMGYQHGLEKKTEIRRILRRIADLTDGDWSELPIPPAAGARLETFFSPDQLEELRGLADAVEVPLSNLEALNLAVLTDLAGNCTQVAMTVQAGERTTTLHGLAGEILLPAALVELLSPLILVREPAQGWACATVTFAGVVGSLIGLNGNGLAASSGALLNGSGRNPAALEVGSTMRVDGLLQRSGTMAQASAILQTARSAGGWNACLSHQDEQLVRTAEYDGVMLAEGNGDHTQIATNHCLLHATSLPAPASSVERLAWLRDRLAGPRAPRDAHQLLTALSELPSPSATRLVVVVDSAQGDVLLDWAKTRERIHVAPLLPTAPAGGETAPEVFDAMVEQELPQATSDDLEYDPAMDGQSLRFTMRIRPSELPGDVGDFPAWKGAAAIHGDGPLADALERRLTAGGATVVRLHQSDSPEQAVAELDRASRDQPIMYLFLTSHRDEPWTDRSSTAGWSQLVERRLLVPYFLCQRMYQLAGDARRLDDCTVVSFVDLGGDFGFSGHVTTPESGFLTGMMKGMYLEHSIVRGFKSVICKAIDAPRSTPVELLAADVCRELAGGTNDYEVAFIDGKRYLQVALPAPTPLEPHSDVRPGGAWVLTGGARGITFECGLEMGRRFGLKLHLIGTSAAPQVEPAWRNLDEQGMASLRNQIILEARKTGRNFSEAWSRVVKAIEIDRNLRALTEAGVRYTYHACDVADREALARVLDEARAADGPIEGILHGAGIEQSARFEKKTRQGALATIAGKITGAINLMELTRQNPVRHFIGFGSTSGRIGGNGQVDYSGASDMLCKLISWYRTQRPECHALGFHWHPWDEVGMAARPETAAILKSHDLVLISKRGGVRHLLRELYTPPAETELLITDWDYHQRFYPKDVDEIARRPDLFGAPGSPPPDVPASEPSATSPAAVTSVRSEKGRVADRVVLRTVDAPLGGGDAGKALPGAAFLLGNNADADALATELASRGVQVHRLPVVDDPQVVCEALELAWRQSPARCLVLLTARDADAGRLDSRAGVAHRMERGVNLPYWVTRRWFQLLSEKNNAQPATLVAVTSLGGDFGFQTPAPAPEGGALSGLLKSIYIENQRNKQSGFCIKAIDFPADEPPARLAESVRRELESGRPELEVAWSGWRRSVVATARQPAEPLPKQEVSRGGTWVVTGGGRGITAATALELGKRYGLKMHLLGKSPPPDPTAPWRNCSEEQIKAMKSSIVRQAVSEGRSPTHDWERVRKDREIQQTLDRFHAAGVSATYHLCDVADWDQLSSTLEKIRAQDGPIEGILHGAGYSKEFRFGAGPVEKLRRTVAPKVDGTLALMHLTSDDPLRWFIAFGSLGGRFGGNGLTDYAAANDMLAKLCGWFRQQRPDCRATCLHWQTWDQIGMVLRSEGVGVTKNTFKMNFIPPEEGVAHVLEELEVGAPENEVLISDGYFQRTFYPYDFERPADEIPTATPTHRSIAAPPSPLITQWQLGAIPGSGTGKIVFDPVADPFLAEHRLSQKPFLPGLVAVEALAEAAQLALGGQPIHELRNLRVVNGLMFNDAAPITVNVNVTPQGQSLKCLLTNELRDRQGRLIDAARVLAEGIVPTDVGEQPIDVPPPGRSPLGWFDYGYFDDAIIVHGPALRCLNGIMLQYDGGWGRIAAPPLAQLAGSRPDQGWILPVAMLDACVVTCAYFMHLQFAGVVEVPYEFERVRWSGTQPTPGQTCIVRLFFRGREERHSTFDFALFTEHDEPLVHATGYRTVLIGATGR